MPHKKPFGGADKGVIGNFKKTSIVYDMNTIICGVFWLPSYRDLYCGNIQSICNHLEINSYCNQKSKGLYIVRASESEFSFQDINCIRFIGNQYYYVCLSIYIFSTFTFTHLHLSNIYICTHAVL